MSSVTVGQSENVWKNLFWKMDLDLSFKDGRKLQNFKAGSFLDVSKLSIDCTYNIIKDSVKSDSCQFDLHLKLSNIHSIKKDLFDKNKNINHHWPRVILTYINDDVQPRDRDVITSDIWISKTYTIDCCRLQPNQRTIQVIVRFCVLFEPTPYVGIQNLSKEIAEMFVQQTRCDVQFYFADDQSIGGHISILSARSPVFSAMFLHEMSETKTGKVDITDIDFDVFKEMLYYIYSGRISSPFRWINQNDKKKAKSLYEVADKYDIDDLKNECVNFLSRLVRVTNTISMMLWAHIHSASRLKQKTLEFFLDHEKEVCQLDDWNMLMKNHPDLCLQATRQKK